MLWNGIENTGFPENTKKKSNVADSNAKPGLSINMCVSFLFCHKAASKIQLAPGSGYSRDLLGNFLKYFNINFNGVCFFCVFGYICNGCFSIILLYPQNIISHVTDSTGRFVPILFPSCVGISRIHIGKFSFNRD